MADDARRAAPEIALGDDAVGDVAARAAADEDLRADAARAVEADDAQRGRGARGEDRGREPGRAGADNDEVGARVLAEAFKRCSQRWRSRTARLGMRHTRCNLSSARRGPLTAPSHISNCEARRRAHETGEINRDRAGAGGRWRAGRRVAAQETNTIGADVPDVQRAVEMPGVTLQPGTYVFKLADTPSRNVVQVWDQDEKNMIGHWLFVQAERPQVTGETVVMFKETREGATPAVQYWYFPGEKIGKEFIYPKDQAERIAARTGATSAPRTASLKGAGIAAVAEASAGASARAPRGGASAEPAPAPAARSRGSTGAPSQRRSRRRRRASVALRPAAQRGAAPGRRRSGQAAPRDELPRTASPLALSGLLGLLSLAGAAGLRLFA